MKKSGIYLTEDGSHSYVSDQFGESYHSRHGAVQESQHVFINAGLMAKKSQSTIHVLEMGFGTGLNAFMTLIEAIRLEKKIHYLGIEAFPIAVEDILKLNFVDELNALEYEPLFQQMHTLESHQTSQLHSYFHFEKRIMDIIELESPSIFDVIYFDAFAPAAQPQLWESELLSKMYKALRPGGILVTYCAKGVVKRTLKSVGFKIEAFPGPPGKREMTRAVKSIDCHL